MAARNPIPDYKVVLDGQDLTDRIRPRLISLKLTEKRDDEADQLDLQIDDSDGRLALPAEGASLQLLLGWKQGTGVPAGLVGKGVFKVDEVEHSGPPDVVTVRARSADMTAQLRLRREQSWHDTTLGEVINDIAGRNGLAARIPPTLGETALPSIIQSRESDMAFLQRLGRRYDAVATVKNGSLLFLPIGAGETASGQPLPSVAITRQQGDRHRFSRRKREDYTGVIAAWQDVKASKRHDVTVGSDKNAKRLSRVYATEQDARTAATAEWGRLQRGIVTLGFSLALGRADLYPEQQVTLSGFKAEIDAHRWLITEVSHSLSNQGFRTDLNLENAV